MFSSITHTVLVIIPSVSPLERLTRTSSTAFASVTACVLMFWDSFPVDASYIADFQLFCADLNELRSFVALFWLSLLLYGIHLVDHLKAKGRARSFASIQEYVSVGKSFKVIIWTSESPNSIGLPFSITLVDMNDDMSAIPFSGHLKGLSSVPQESFRNDIMLFSGSCAVHVRGSMVAPMVLMADSNSAYASLAFLIDASAIPFSPKDTPILQHA